MFLEACELLKARRSVILDASFLRQKDREQAFKVALDQGAAVWFVECITSEAEVRSRLARRASDGQAVSDGRLELMAQQRGDWEPTSEIFERSKICLETSGDLEGVVSDFLEMLYQKVLEHQG